MTTSAKQAAKSWSSTLRLPKSTFPARPAAADTAKYLRRCSDDLYQWQREERPATDTFTLHDGPPYANGQLHVGHALNKILKDIVCRTQLAKGRRVNYVPGWDCHGLPIELKALAQHGWRKGGDEDAVTVRKAARRFAEVAIGEQMHGFRSWGVMGDWAGRWTTMDKEFELRQLTVFKELAREGLIYRKHKPVYWSPSSQTALAEAELEYRDDHVSTAVLVKFPLIHHPFGQDLQTVSAVIWTTTPWTIPANQAIAVRKDLEYVVVRSENHGHLLIANSRRDFVSELIKENLREVKLMALGSTLLDGHPKYKSPFNISESIRPFFHADFVKPDAGTGLVHCAPGHGHEDYQALGPLIEKKEVAVLAPVDVNGCFTTDVKAEAGSRLKGKYVLTDGNRAIVDELKEQRSLMASYEYVHSSPYDWRTKEPVIVRATAQWFADVSSIRDETVASLQHVRFFPPSGKMRLTSFVRNRSEWCISRQRAWGMPIPALYRVDDGEVILTPESIEHIIKVIEERGSDAWWSDPGTDPAWILPQLLQKESSERFRRGSDTMDVWFDSGTSWSQLPGGIQGKREALADVYLEGSDQHRGWFQSSILTHIGYQKSKQSGISAAAPFLSLITHGFTLDERGRKMSKSEGNVIAPEEIIQGLAPAVDTAKKNRKKDKAGSSRSSLGPDALRLWVASSDFTKDVVISDTVIKNVHAALHKYRVTFKLLLGALDGFSLALSIPYSQLNQMDQIALYQLSQVKKVVLKAFEEHEFHRAATAINRWVNIDLSGVYIEAIKDSLYCDDSGEPTRRAVQTTLYHIWIELNAMLAPFTPLLIEESWEHAPPSIKAQDVHPLRKPRTFPPEEWDNQEIETSLPVLLTASVAVKAAQERARMAKSMGSSLESFVTLLAPDDSPGRRALAAWQGSAMRELLVVSDLQSKLGTVGDVLGDSPDSSRWIYREPIELGSDTKGWAIVRKPDSAKCARCWRYRADGDAYNRDLKLQASNDGRSRSQEKSTEEHSLCVRCKKVVENFEWTRRNDVQQQFSHK